MFDKFMNKLIFNCGLHYQEKDIFMFCNSGKVFISLFLAITISWPRLAINILSHGCQVSSFWLETPVFRLNLQFWDLLSKKNLHLKMAYILCQYIYIIIINYCTANIKAHHDLRYCEKSEIEKLRSHSPSCLCLFTQSNPFKSWKRETLFYGLEKQTLINPNRTWSSILTIQLALYKPAHVFKPPYKHNGAEC